MRVKAGSRTAVEVCPSFSQQCPTMQGRMPSLTERHSWVLGSPAAGHNSAVEAVRRSLAHRCGTAGPDSKTWWDVVAVAVAVACFWRLWLVCYSALIGTGGEEARSYRQLAGWELRGWRVRVPGNRVVTIPCRRLGVGWCTEERQRCERERRERRVRRACG